MRMRRARRFKYKLRYKNQNTESRFQVYKCRMQIQVRNNLNKNDLAKSQAIRARLMMTNMRRSTTQTIRGQDWWSYFFMVLIRFLWSSVFFNWVFLFFFTPISQKFFFYYYHYPNICNMRVKGVKGDARARRLPSKLMWSCFRISVIVCKLF